MNCDWLPLTEYSSKYRVSISTLRRRIKEEAIPYKFEDGKYFIGDEPISAHQKVHRPSQQNSEDGLMSAVSTKKTVMEKAPFFGLNLDFEEDTKKNQGLQNFSKKSSQIQSTHSSLTASQLSQAVAKQGLSLSKQEIENRKFLNDLAAQQEKAANKYLDLDQEAVTYETYEAPLSNFNKPEPASINQKIQNVFHEIQNQSVKTSFEPVTFQKQNNFNSQNLNSTLQNGLGAYSAAAAKAKNDEPILNEANKLLGELKKAYTLVLQEKEEQILKLRQENADLKTYVKALESENERLVRNKEQNDLWILG